MYRDRAAERREDKVAGRGRGLSSFCPQPNVTLGSVCTRTRARAKRARTIQNHDLSKTNRKRASTEPRLRASTTTRAETNNLSKYNDACANLFNKLVEIKTKKTREQNPDYAQDDDASATFLIK